MNFLASLLTVVFLVFLAPTEVRAEEKAEHKIFDDGWWVSKFDDSCMASRSYDDGNLLTVSYYARLDTAFLHIESATATSIEDGQEVGIYIFFVGKNSVDDGWGRKSFTARITSEGRRSFMTSLDGADLLADIAKYNSIAFTADAEAKKILGNYLLDGSARAVKALRKCSFEVENLNPEDPFLP